MLCNQRIVTAIYSFVPIVLCFREETFTADYCPGTRQIIKEVQFNRKDASIPCVVSCLETRNCISASVCAVAEGTRCVLLAEIYSNDTGVCLNNCRNYLMSSLNESTEEIPCENATDPFKVFNGTPSFGCGDCDCVSLSTSESGEYTLNIQGTLVRVLCLFKLGQVWTVIQRRMNGNVDFYRNWREYAEGFGCISSSLWIGNDIIHALTSTGHNHLRLEMVDENDIEYYIEYTYFAIDGETDKYRMHISNVGSVGNASDTFSGNCATYCHDNMKFTTYDMDNDEKSSASCAVKYRSAWWYQNCFYLNLNGDYTERTLMWWKSGQKILSKAQMLLRK